MGNDPLNNGAFVFLVFGMDMIKVWRWCTDFP